MRNMHGAQRTIAAFRMCTKIGKRVTTIILLLLLYYVHGTLSIIIRDDDSGGETFIIYNIRTAEGQYIYTRIPVFVQRQRQQQYDVHILCLCR